MYNTSILGRTFYFIVRCIKNVVLNIKNIITVKFERDKSIISHIEGVKFSEKEMDFRSSHALKCILKLRKNRTQPYILL